MDVTTEADRYGDAGRFADAFEAAVQQQTAEDGLASKQPGAAEEEQRHRAVRCLTETVPSSSRRASGQQQFVTTMSRIRSIHI